MPYIRDFMVHVWCYCHIIQGQWVNTLRPRQNGHHFADDIFKCIFLNENVWIPIKISMNCVPKGPIDNNPPLVQIMAWRCPGDKPLSEPMMVNSVSPGRSFKNQVIIFRIKFLLKMSESFISVTPNFLHNDPIGDKLVLVLVMAWHQNWTK